MQLEIKIRAQNTIIIFKYSELYLKENRKKNTKFN